MSADLLIFLLLNPCGMLSAGAVMYAAGNLASSGQGDLRRFGAALAGLALVAVMTFGIIRRMDLFELAIGAAGCGLFILGTTWIILTLLAGVFTALTSAMTPPYEPEVIYVPIREPAQEPEPPLLLPPPPTPTRDELAAHAKQRYESTLRMLETAGLDATELTSAQAAAKQKYLRDLDELVK